MQYQKSRIVLASILVSLLAACGGGDSGSASVNSPVFSGTAAVGVPIVGGTVNVSCAAGAALSTTTSPTGTWSVTTSGQTLPCAVQVINGTVAGVANTTPYHSIAVSFGTVNITPLTNLVVANLVAGSPQTWFSNPVFTNVRSSALSTSLASVSNALGLSSTLGSIDPFTATFLAQNGDKIDDVLEAIKIALANLERTYADLLTASGANNFESFSGFGTAFSTVYINLTGTGGTGSGTVSNGSGTGTLTVVTAIAGVSSPSVVINGVTKPANQADFCSGIQSDSSITNLSASGGTLTINSCSFSGNVGTIAATLSITTPFAFSTAYTITYTYN